MIETLPDKQTLAIASKQYLVRSKWRYDDFNFHGLAGCLSNTTLRIAPYDTLVRLEANPSHQALQVFNEAYETDTNRDAMAALCAVVETPAKHILYLSTALEEEIGKQQGLRQRLLQEALLQTDFVAKVSEQMDLMMLCLPPVLVERQPIQNSVVVESLKPWPEIDGHYREYVVERKSPHLILAAHVVLAI